METKKIKNFLASPFQELEQEKGRQRKLKRGMKSGDR